MLHFDIILQNEAQHIFLDRKGEKEKKEQKKLKLRENRKSSFGICYLVTPVLHILTTSNNLCWI